MNTSRNEYHLFAVLVHDGKEAGTGHYWSYIRRARRRPAQQQAEEQQRDSGHFWKYNDAIVSAVDDATVWRESEGGQQSTNASAYFLIYVRRSELEQEAAETADIASLFPPALLREVEADNVAFQRETEEWDRKQEDKMVEAEAAQVKTAFLAAHAAMLEAAGKKEGEDSADYHLMSLPCHLLLLRQRSVAEYLLLEAMLKAVRHEDERVRGRIVERSCALLLKDDKLVASRVQGDGLNEQEKEMVRSLSDEYRQYVDLTVLSLQGVNALLYACDPYAATLFLLRAWSALPEAAVAAVPPTAVRTDWTLKRKEVTFLLNLCVYVLFMLGKLRVKAASGSGYAELLAVNTATQLLPTLREWCGAGGGHGQQRPGGRLAAARRRERLPHQWGGRGQREAGAPRLRLLCSAQLSARQAGVAGGGGEGAQGHRA